MSEHNPRKLPSFQFYPGDWLKDPSLRFCSHFARGLLVDLLCLMFENCHRGRLCRTDGITPLTDEQIVDASSGGSREDKVKALQELIENGALKREQYGVLYSARMVRDEEIRKARAENGGKGGAQKQANRVANRVANHLANPLANSLANSTPSSSSSSSSSEEEIKTSPTASAAPASPSPDPPIESKKPKPKREPSGDHQHAIAYFCESWKCVYSSDYPFDAARGKNAKLIQTILKACGSLDRFKQAVDKFLQTRNEFLNERKHQLQFLQSGLAEYLAGEPAPVNHRPAKSLDEILSSSERAWS